MGNGWRQCRSNAKLVDTRSTNLKGCSQLLHEIESWKKPLSARGTESAIRLGYDIKWLDPPATFLPRDWCTMQTILIGGFPSQSTFHHLSKRPGSSGSCENIWYDTRNPPGLRSPSTERGSCWKFSRAPCCRWPPTPCGVPHLLNCRPHDSFHLGWCRCTVFHADTSRPSTFLLCQHRSCRAIGHPGHPGRDCMQLKADGTRGEGAALHAPLLGVGGRSFSGRRMAARIWD